MDKKELLYLTNDINFNRDYINKYLKDIIDFISEIERLDFITNIIKYWYERGSYQMVYAFISYYFDIIYKETGLFGEHNKDNISYNYVIRFTNENEYKLITYKNNEERDIKDITFFNKDNHMVKKIKYTKLNNKDFVSFVIDVNYEKFERIVTHYRDNNSYTKTTYVNSKVVEVLFVNTETIKEYIYKKVVYTREPRKLTKREITFYNHRGIIKREIIEFINEKEKLQDKNNFHIN